MSIPPTFKRNPVRDPIAVVGMGCRVPGADTVDDYWELLLDARTAVSEVPASRWNVDEIGLDRQHDKQQGFLRWGGFLDRGDAFDANLFGISDREAQHMDPQQGLLLEAAWQALENGAIPVGSLRLRDVGVYVGISTCDYDRMLSRNLDSLDSPAGTGTSYSICANRISYTFGLRGPSCTVDVACSSSLVAVHLACQSLWSGETEMALAGGAHLILSPVKTITLAAAGLLAPDGRCKCFSEHANGYVRGEGVGIVVLMPLDAAIRDGHRVLALILGSAVNHNGVSNGLSGPSGAAQQELIRTALSRSGVKPSQIGYVEAHALGTRIGDEIEVRALSEVLSDGRIRGDRLIVGSAKGNFGHLEAAAGIAAFIKTAMILEKGIIPKTVGAEPLSGKLQPTDFLYIATAKHVWPDDSDARKAAVSSLSFGGANAHIVMQKAPFTGTPTQNRDQYYVLTFSANSTAALDALAHRYVEFLSKEQRVTESFADVCFTAAVGREPLPHRIAIVAKSFVDAADTLTRLLSRSAERTKAFRGHAVRRNTGRRSWIFDGSVRVDLSDAPDPVNSMYLEIRDLLATNDAMRSVLNNGSDVEPPLSTVALGAVVCAMIRSPAAVVGDDVEQCVSKALADQVWRSQSLIDPIGVKSVPQYAAKAVSEVSGIAEKWYFCAYERDLSESADRRNELRVPTFQMDENGSVGVVGGMEIARALAHAHVAGELIDWNRVFGVLRRTSVPLYPFERTTHWRTTAVS